MVKTTAWKYWHSYLHWSNDLPNFPLVSTSLPYICPQQIWSESMSYQLQKHIFWFTLLNVIAILGKSGEYIPSFLWLLQTGGRTIAKNWKVVFTLKIYLSRFSSSPLFQVSIHGFISDLFRLMDNRILRTLKYSVNNEIRCTIYLSV